MTGAPQPEQDPTPQAIPEPAAGAGAAVEVAREGYPSAWEADVVVSDGGVVHVRPIRPEDADALVAFHAKLSDRTRYLRYFGSYPRIPERDLHHFTHVDHRNR
ncbi:MAG TPA: hypothetical protein VE198_08235, partial [Actinoallomurus sp.]|nr:hypothetical protein [Actinoallomurus sp.]